MTLAASNSTGIRMLHVIYCLFEVGSSASGSCFPENAFAAIINPYISTGMRIIAVTIAIITLDGAPVAEQ